MAATVLFPSQNRIIFCDACYLICINTTHFALPINTGSPQPNMLEWRLVIFSRKLP
jgi:hypothetical protein